MKNDGLSNARSARRERILNAAEYLFTRHGFRATTMEAIAEQAGVAKATVYAYFNDKDAAFCGVSERLSGRLLEAVSNALSAGSPTTDRISEALIAKHRIVHDLVRSSPHAAEIFAVHNRISGTLFSKTDAQIRTLLSGVLVDTLPRKRAEGAARLLFAAAQGIAGGSADFDVVANDIRLLVGAVVAGVARTETTG